MCDEFAVYVTLIVRVIYFSAVTSPGCTASRQSASGNESVTFTCAVTKCGTASVPMTIKKDGSDVATGTNTATWQTTADDVKDADVTCSANFGDAVACPKIHTSKCNLAFFANVYA